MGEVGRMQDDSSTLAPANGEIGEAKTDGRRKSAVLVLRQGWRVTR